MMDTKLTETQKTNKESHTAQRIAGIIFGAIEFVLAFRLVFKWMGANPKNGFVHGLYTVTQFFVGIFEGIFARTAVGGVGVAPVFEPATLIAMAVIALIAWVVIKLMTPRVGTTVKNERTEIDQQIK